MADERREREQRFERRMSDAEALMWNIDKDPWLNPSGCSLLILDGPIDVDHFRGHVAQAVAEVPWLRERVVATLGRLSPPEWRPDPEFDLDYHIRHVVLAPPGTMRDLLDLVSNLYQDPYDRTRPLWAFHVIDGLEGGRSALLWKLHHALADGLGAGGIADYHLQRSRQAAAAGAPVPALNISFVVSTREDRSTGGNAMTPTRLQVPGHTMDPAERFGVVSQRLAARRAEVRGRGMLAGLAGVANLLPTSFVTSVARSQAGKIDFATSNLRGARSAQYVSGAEVLHKLAFGPVAGTAFNLTAFSYNGRFDMALAVDPAAVHEPAELRQHLEYGYAELLEASGVGT